MAKPWKWPKQIRYESCEVLTAYAGAWQALLLAPDLDDVVTLITTIADMRRRGEPLPGAELVFAMMER
eukprot:2161160-Amphidinium_carterae.1